MKATPKRVASQGIATLKPPYPDFEDSTSEKAFWLTKSIKLLGNPAPGPCQAAVVQTYPVPSAKFLCIINPHHVFALQHAKEEWQRTSLLEHRRKQAVRGGPRRSTSRSLSG